MTINGAEDGASGGAMVIVGAGLAGDSAAEQLRKSGWAGGIVMIGDEHDRPYDRPPLSKAALVSAAAQDSLYFHPAVWYEEQGIELVLGETAERVDPDTQSVLLSSGRSIPFIKLLIATGARPRRLPMLEAGAAPVFTLRALEDARRLAPLLLPDARVVIIGGGVIGLEIAASASQIGCRVTVVEALPRVMARGTCSALSDFLTGYHRSRGVTLICDARIDAVTPRGSGSRIQLQSGEFVVADVIVVGIGVLPNSELAKTAGLAIADGIVVDEQTRTSHPLIHAAGDVACFRDGAEHRRAEHWRHAIDQAIIAARVMVGESCIYQPAPWLWSDQYDLNIQITGRGVGDTDVLRGDIDARGFTIFHLAESHLVGATSVNQGRLKRQIAQLVALRPRVDPASLRDISVELKTIAAMAA